MFDLADRAIGAAVKFVEYLEAAGPDWKKEFLARRRDKFRQQRAKRAAAKCQPTEGTPDPEENSRPEPEPEREREREPEPER